MLTSKKYTNYKLNIYISEDYKYLVKISVFNYHNRIVKSEISDMFETRYDLPQGIYTLRVEMNGDIKDEIILLNQTLAYEITDKEQSSYRNAKALMPPRQFSSALLGDAYGSSHEYYTDPAVHYSLKDTFVTSIKSRKNSNSSLFIFLRFPSYQRYQELKTTLKKPFYTDFKLVDEKGKTIAAFKSKKRVVVDEDYGWVTFNAKLPNGIYYLIFNGHQKRQIPISVFKDWHTQFFMTLDKSPLYGTIRTFISGNRKFYPEEKTYKYIDILLDKLQNKDYTLDEDMIHMAAYGKYQSPMLGLICAYIYLKSENNQNDNLFKAITQNLSYVILKDNYESPDLRALNILASKHFPDYKYNTKEVHGTPMFRIGFEAILNASVEDNDLIPQNSINDFISENLYFDSPFNTFKPIPFPQKKKQVKRVKINKRIDLSDDINMYGIDNKDYLNPNSPGKSFPIIGDEIPNVDDFISVNEDEFILVNEDELTPIIGSYSSSIKSEIDESLFEYIESSRTVKSEESWIESSIMDIIKQNKSASVNDISKDLNISGNTVNRIFSEWKNEFKK
jgi:hypothetical protein